MNQIIANFGLTDLLIINILSWGFIGSIIIWGKYANKKKRDTRRASRKRQIHKTEINVQKNMDVRP